MKNVFLVGLIALSFLLVSCSGNSIVGKYKNADTITGGYFEFTDDGHFIIYSKGSKPRRGTYIVDNSKSPKYLDLTMDANNVNPDGNSKGKSFSAAGIYKFEGNKLTLKSANGGDVSSIHPSDFSPSAGYVNMELERYDGAIPMEYQSEPVEIRVATPKP